jgi:23S rRNA (pseudouridine1915-N3)-methyltransferase
MDMKIEVISVEKTKTKFILDGEEFYLKRLSPFIKTSITEIGSGECAKRKDAERSRCETDLLRKKIGSKDFLVVLDESGKIFESISFAKFVEKRMLSGISRLVFAVGGAYGWDKSILKEAHETLSLSKMTFTYEMSRFILLEQVYRAMNIIKGTQYHKY